MRLPCFRLLFSDLVKQSINRKSDEKSLQSAALNFFRNGAVRLPEEK